MRRAIPGVMAFSLGLLGVVPVAVAGPASASAVPQITGGSESVIVVLRHQYSFPGTAAGTRQRTAAADAAQAPVMASLKASHATQVTQLHLIDAVVATVSPAEAAALAANPTVAEVTPNAEMKGPGPARATPGRTAAAAGSSTLAAGVCPPQGQVQLNPEGVENVHAVSADPGVPTARKLGFTGAGITVGDMAVGINPNEIEMIRPNGQHVIADYKDFTGEGTKVQGGEDLESYLDDSIMAAQGRLVYDLHDYTPAMPAGCDIRLQGVAPGITIDAYKVYGDEDMTTLSAMVESVDYAVDVNHVNVLNEEGGWFPFPDDNALDLLKATNAAAMAAGVTITSPSYDSGPQNSIWSPSSQPGVISTGASTSFRSYAQDDTGEYNQMNAHGWVSDNISALSSGGSTQEGRSIDVVAPGDLDWVACGGDKPACGGSNLIQSGGTSEAGPLTAAVCALVIQAYRSTHDQQDPSVSLVRDIISSSADDLGMPGSEQGSGLVDAYRAVRAALAANGGQPAKGAGGPALVASTQQLDAIGNPSAPVKMSFHLTNEGTRPANVALSARTTGAPTVVLAKSLHRTDSTGDQIIHFALPYGAATLTADVADPGGPASNPVAISLLNPKGQITAFSLPQGTGDHGQVEVRQPKAGIWTLDVSTPYGPYSGPVHVQVTTSPTPGWGTVSPSHVVLAPGASTKVTLDGTFPASPGDRSVSVAMTAPGWGDSSIPVTLRALVPIVNGTGSFHASLVGGNGRGGVPAQTFFYNFDVPAGQPALDVQAKLGGHNDDPFYGYLVDPQGSAVALSSNQVVVKQTPSGPVTVGEPGTRMHVLSPPAGQWTLILTFTNPVTGNTLATPLNGTISFAPITATTQGLPDSAATTLTAGQTYVAKVSVTNSGDAAEAYFLDGRLNRSASLALSPITPATDITLPLSAYAPEPQWIVPTDTSALAAAATSSAPTTFDFSPYDGDPDTGATVSGNDASAAITAPAGSWLTQGDWDIDPNRVGPFGSTGASPSTTSLTLTATTEAFNRAMSSSTGDLWLQGAKARGAFSPVLVQPGQTTTLYLEITPAGTAGSVVHGTLYLDDSSAVTNDGVAPTGDQLTAIPYTYTTG
ncbi:MAG TPA: hypothetical protein VGH27_19375 [Streptosporangiaceae bacterium]